jgi:hypothetical protein
MISIVSLKSLGFHDQAHTLALSHPRRLPPLATAELGQQPIPWAEELSPTFPSKQKLALANPQDRGNGTKVIA